MSLISNSLVFIILISLGVAFCTCAPPNHWEKLMPLEYENSDDVFIGEVKIICNDEFKYELEVCEVFKGDLQPGQRILGHNLIYCGPFVGKTGEWLLYGNYSVDFTVNDCGLSTNIQEPSSNGFLLLDMPSNKRNSSELKDEYQNKLQHEKQKQISSLRFLSNSAIGNN